MEVSQHEIRNPKATAVNNLATVHLTRSKIMKAVRIAIIIGSTRPGRNGEAVTKWVYEIAQKRSDGP